MADSDKTLKIVIEGDASSAVAATTQVNEGFKKIKIDCSDLGESTKRSLGIMPTAAEESEKAMRKLVDSEKDGTGVAELLHHSHRLVHTALHSIAHDSGPAASAAIAGIGVAAGGGIGAGVMLGQQLISVLEGIQKAADEAAAKVRERFADITDEMNQAGTNVHDLSIKFDEFWEGLSRKTAQNAVKEQFDQMLAQIKNLAGAAAGNKVATKEAAAEFVSRETSARETARAGALETSVAALEKQLQEIRPLLTDDAAKKREQESLQLKDELAKLVDAYRTGKGFTPQGVEKNSVGVMLDASGGDPGWFGQNKEAADANKAGRKQQFETINATIVEEIQAREDANRKLQEHVKLVEETITRMTEEAQKLREDVATTGQKDATERFGTAKAFADTLSHGGTVSSAQATYLVLLEQAITGHNLTLAEAVRLMEAQTVNANFTLTLLGNVYQKIEAVRAGLEQLAHQHNTSRNTQGGQG